MITSTSSKLSTQPYKGARDFYPDDMRIRNYIFDVWRKTAKSFGFDEYDFPFLEPLELYEAKSGEELVKNQLYRFKDKGEREIAIRPEKTPSAARLVAARIKELPRPIKWFNIGNCWRFEKPQKGRGREFFQFDCDIFGSNSVLADAEVLSIPVEVMKKLGATENMFEIRVCNRRLTEFYLKDVVKLGGGIGESGTQMYKVAKIIDSKPKITHVAFEKELTEAGLSPSQIDSLQKFIEADISFVSKFVNDCYGAKEIVEFFEIMNGRGCDKYFKFCPEIMRGLDYYTGNVVEQFDLNPKNNRSMYGGGRYDNLVSEFADENLPGVGFAMGDITLLEFLKGWNLLPTFAPETQYLITLWPSQDSQYAKASFEAASALRKNGKNVELWTEPNTKLDKQLKYADKKGIPFVVIIGENELKE
ncbi:histidine--tRNA ligase, partial [candidate division WWE3 bacterium]|nr:histidine--tRNA ligase [candidate division WWE3 bacterium]